MCVCVQLGLHGLGLGCGVGRRRNAGTRTFLEKVGLGRGYDMACKIYLKIIHM